MCGYLFAILHSIPRCNIYLVKMIHRLLLIILACVVSSMGNAQQGQQVRIIPQPVSIAERTGVFIFDKNVVVFVSKEDREKLPELPFFLQHINIATGINLVLVNDSSSEKTFHIKLLPGYLKAEEGYTMNITGKRIVLTANKPAGVFYGLQSFIQLLPPEKSSLFSIPCADITDYPRFGWRGLMLDVSRHFFTKEEVKKYIDEMARYKFNVFHWHLTDDSGWRIAIKSLPELTEIGAWRVPRTGGAWSYLQPAEPGEAATDGGFYTQEDIKEIIQYAQQRFITVLPEIDVPGHSLALIASYPNLSCTQKKYNVNPGTQFFTKEDNALCVGNDSVFVILDKIFTEVAELFPSQYIHIGGDEAFKGFWETCTKCRKRLASEHLKDTKELQSYFIRRIEKMLQLKGKKIIGWDEILQGGLAPDATVMSWRGIEGGMEAAKQKHKVIMTPSSTTYLDLYQGDQNAEPPTYGINTLANVYRYEPLPAGVNAPYILGGQGSLWSEAVPTFRHAEYMTWPRGMALAEIFWSPKNKRNWDNFIERVENEFKRMDAVNINYAKSMYDAMIRTSIDKNGILFFRLTCEVNNTDIYYTFDNTNPDSFSRKYTGGNISFPKGAAQLKIITYRNGRPSGKQYRVYLDELIKRAKEKPDF
jgi:hexosaminidase